MNYTKHDFPQLEHLSSKGITYLDSAATSLKHSSYLDAFLKFETTSVSNVHRGVHRLSSSATDMFESTRQKTASYLNVEPDQIVFTKGTTESVNLVASSLNLNLDSSSALLITEMEHHANILPWQKLCHSTGAELLVAPLTDKGDLDLEALDLIFSTKNIKLFSFSHVSNTLGTVNPIDELIKICKKNSCLSFVDGAQGATLFQPNLKELQPDFYAFSAHKCFGPFGLGILFSTQIENLKPYQVGGAIIDQVNYQSSTFLKGPQKLEPGTPNISSVVSFNACLDFLKALDFDKIREEESYILKSTEGIFEKIDGYQPVGQSETRKNILSFNFEGVHAHDLCELLDEQGFALRSGHHCTQPLLKKLGLKSCARASFSIYNTAEDGKRLAEAVKTSLRLLR